MPNQNRDLHPSLHCSTLPLSSGALDQTSELPPPLEPRVFTADSVFLIAVRPVEIHA